MQSPPPEAWHGTTILTVLTEPRAAALSDESAQRVRLRLRDHAGSDRGVDVVAFQAQGVSMPALRTTIDQAFNVSTVTLRLV